jgi:urease alpha subunit
MVSLGHQDDAYTDGSDKIKSYGIKKRPEAVKNCRKITKKDMKLNDAMPKMTGKWDIETLLWQALTKQSIRRHTR